MYNSKFICEYTVCVICSLAIDNLRVDNSNAADGIKKKYIYLPRYMHILKTLEARTGV